MPVIILELEGTLETTWLDPSYYRDQMAPPGSQSQFTGNAKIQLSGCRETHRNKEIIVVNIIFKKSTLILGNHMILMYGGSLY